MTPLGLATAAALSVLAAFRAAPKAPWMPDPGPVDVVLLATGEVLGESELCG